MLENPVTPRRYVFSQIRHNSAGRGNQQAPFRFTKSVSETVWTRVDFGHSKTTQETVRFRSKERKHFDLITQVQFTGDETINYDTNSTRTNNYRLNFNHPVKSLMWVCTDPNKHGLFNAGIVPGRVGECLNPIDSVKLLLNGHDRFSSRKGSYFTKVQPFQATKTAPVTGVNLYSFSLSPAEHQPSGSVNMSRIDNATLVVTTKKLVAFTGNASTSPALFANAGSVETQVANTAGALTTLRIYAESYNVMRIMSGMGGLAYSN